MILETREVGPESSDAWREIVDLVYRQRPADEPYGPSRAGERRFLAYRGSRPAAACSVVSTVLARGESDLPCGAVASVATLPEHRRSGAATHLMVSVLGAMRDGGLAVAALYAFREPFYRRLGYASCGWRWQIKCPVHRLPPTEGGLVACRLPAEQAPALDPVYVGFVRARSGSFLRTADDWRERLGKRPPLVYAFGNPAEAYLWFSVHDAWAEVDVGEFAWTTARGYSSGLAFMAGVAANQSTVSWCEPPDGPYVSAGIDQGASVCLHRPSMFRVVDVRRALNPLASLGRPLRIEVLDRSADWNQGVWLVDGEVKPGPGRRPDVSTTVGSLAQMVLGARSARQLAADGALSASSLEAIEALEKAFPPAPVVCMDFF